MTVATWTLEDALTLGEGIERPFRCTAHDDTNASASVNVLKMVWHCYACKANGMADDKKAPSAQLLLSMLEPERAVRVYPEAWLDLFRDRGYWLTRFPEWLCWWMGLGIDPYTGDAVFPVRTPNGLLAGVGRRLAEPGEGPRYKYPARWSASRTMGGLTVLNTSDPVGVLVEGYADMTAVREVGADSLAVFGSGMHLPQRELLLRQGKRLVLFGFDMDDAGERAVARAQEDLSSYVTTERIRWPKKDPADCSVKQRRKALLDAIARANDSVGAQVYVPDQITKGWDHRVERAKVEFANWQREVA